MYALKIYDFFLSEISVQVLDNSGLSFNWDYFVGHPVEGMKSLNWHLLNF